MTGVQTCALPIWSLLFMAQMKSAELSDHLFLLNVTSSVGHPSAAREVFTYHVARIYLSSLAAPPLSPSLLGPASFNVVSRMLLNGICGLTYKVEAGVDFFFFFFFVAESSSSLQAKRWRERQRVREKEEKERGQSYI